MADLSLRNVKKVYDNSVTAVQDFNLEIADKEFIVLVGPSGCGKTTLLRMIMGEEETDEGTVTTANHVVMRYLPQHPEFHTMAR